jgi:hypothetical protein
MIISPGQPAQAWASGPEGWDPRPWTGLPGRAMIGGYGAMMDAVGRPRRDPGGTPPWCPPVAAGGYSGTAEPARRLDRRSGGHLASGGIAAEREMFSAQAAKSRAGDVQDGTR